MGQEEMRGLRRGREGYDRRGARGGDWRRARRREGSLDRVHRRYFERRGDSRERADRPGGRRGESLRRVRARFASRLGPHGRDEILAQQGGDAPAPAAEPRRKALARARTVAKFSPDATYEKAYALDPGHVSVGEIKFQHALKDFDRTKAILRQGAMADESRWHLPQLIPSHLPGQGL